MNSRQGKKAAIFTAAALAAVSISQSQAQQAQPGGVVATLDFSTRFEADDNDGLDVNSPGTTYTSTTRLTFGLSSETPISTLRASVGGGFRAEEGPGGFDTEVDTPTVSINYDRDVGRSRFGFDAQYRKSEVDDAFLVDLDGDLIADDLIVDTGDLEIYDVGVDLQTGVGGPLSFDFSLRRNERNYSGTSDPSLNDSDTTEGDVTARFRISPVATGRVGVSRVEFSEPTNNNTQRDTNSAFVGLAYDVSSVWSFDGQLGFTEVETTTTTSTTVRDGLSGNLNLTREMPNGTLSGSLSQTVSSTGDRTTLQVNRSLVLPRGDLSFGVGLSDSDNGSAQPLYTVRLTRDLPDGTIRFGIAQRASTTTASEEVLTTTVDLGYQRTINALSRLDVDFGLGRTDDIGAGAVREVTRANFGVTYSRELTPDWDWSVGYQARYTKDVGSPSATSNAIFTSIDRTFSIRP